MVSKILILASFLFAMKAFPANCGPYVSGRISDFKVGDVLHAGDYSPWLFGESAVRFVILDKLNPGTQDEVVLARRVNYELRDGSFEPVRVAPNEIKQIVYLDLSYRVRHLDTVRVTKVSTSQSNLQSLWRNPGDLNPGQVLIYNRLLWMVGESFEGRPHLQLVGLELAGSGVKLSNPRRNLDLTFEIAGNICKVEGQVVPYETAWNNFQRITQPVFSSLDTNTIQTALRNNQSIDVPWEYTISR